MDVCVRTDPAAPNRALEIIPQNTGVVSSACSCTNSSGAMQVTPPLIVTHEDVDLIVDLLALALADLQLELPDE